MYDCIITNKKGYFNPTRFTSVALILYAPGSPSGHKRYQSYRVTTLEVQFFKDQIILCHLNSKGSTDNQAFEAAMKTLETT